MSRRCRASLIDTTRITEGGFGSGCLCGRHQSGIGTPCAEPLVYGSLLRDPGLEKIFDLQEQRNWLGVYSKFDPGPGWQWTNLANDPEGFLGRDSLLPWWANGEDSVFLNTVEQRSDIYCAEIDIISASVPYMTSGNTISCNFQDSLTFAELRPAFRTQFGDLVTVGCWAKFTVASGVLEDLGVKLQVISIDNDIGGTSFTTQVDRVAQSTAYAYYETSAFVDIEDAYWMWPRIGGAQIGAGTGTVYIDDCLLLLTPASTDGILLCAFSSLVTVDNDTTETSFL